MTSFIQKLSKLIVSISNKEKSLNFIQKANYYIIENNDQPFSVLYLLPPTTPADHPDQVEQIANIARKHESNYFISWNLRDMVLWRTPNKSSKATREYCVKTYFTIQRIPQVENPVLNPYIESLLKQRLQEVLDDLNTLQKVGHLYNVDIDATFFVHRLHQAINVMSPLLKKSLATQMYLKPQFKKDISAWAVKQGIANYDKDEFLEAISRQIVYRLLGRIIFYESLRRYLRDLPEPDFSSLDTSFILKKLNQCFEKAREIDYQAVFEEEIIDNVPYPQDALIELQSLLDDLNRYNFTNMPQDVIGNVFEQLIPAEERHALGQYFTREDLVDFINAFCIQTKNDVVLDPTCGTGTFLIRAYNRLKFLGERNHQNLLQKLWGIDIARFPAQLATINLFRQKIEDSNNFPRIISQDFFQVSENTVFRFPPPRLNTERSNYIEESFPQFDAIIGNFPYIRQELIEKRVKGYKKSMEKTLASEWLPTYPDAFALKPKEKKELKLSQENGFDLSGMYEKAKLLLSGQADIYSYLFFHSAHFLKENSRMGIVTSNAWLDVAYGYELQKFFLNNFRIIAIVESRCEPWFQDASINTIFTILERCTDEKQRRNHLVKFVKVKKRLQKLIPWDIKNPLHRWQGIDKLVRKIERTGSELFSLQQNEYVCTLKGHKTYEDDDFRIRILRQDELLEEVQREGKTVKWGKYIRAPEVYFEVFENNKRKLNQLKKISSVETYLNTGGANKFFFLKSIIEDIKNKDKQDLTAMEVENGDGFTCKIEKEFLTPLIKSSHENKNILINEIKNWVLTIDKKKYKENLPKFVQKYISWGEQNNYNKKSGTKSRNPWYTLPKQAFEGAPIICGRSFNDRFLFFFNPEKCVSDRFYRIIPNNSKDNKLTCSFLNSTLIALQIECNGIVNLGEGVLNIYINEIENLLLPIIEKIDEQHKRRVIDNFFKIFDKPIKSIFEEIKIIERQKFDSAVLEAIGLNAKEYLPKIYDGLCELVRERLEIPKLRKGTKQKSTRRSVDNIKENVVNELLPEGVKNFPDDFFDTQIKQKAFKELHLPNCDLKYSQPFFGDTTITGENGFEYHSKNPSEVKYIKYAHHSGIKLVTIPDTPIHILKVVSAYERYIKDLQNKLFENIYNRTHDQKLSHQMIQSILEEHKIPEIHK